MNYFRIFFILLIFICWQSVNAETIIYDQLSRQQLADNLGWISDVNSDNLCGGYYREPEIIVKYPAPGSIKKEQVTITAKQPVIYSALGDSVLRGDVSISQPGREVTADKVVLNRDKKTKKITSADLYGHVHMRESGKLIVGDHAYINFVDKSIVINHCVYRLFAASPTGNVNLSGRALEINRDADQALILKNASYSTCQPNCNTWYIKSKNMRLNKNSGVGTVKNAVFYVKDIPAFYLPYFRFPIDKRRKSGFLFPTFGYSTKAGFDFTLPYYLNLAPNYDATITPRFITKRGLLGNGRFRFLTTSSSGDLRVSYIYDDRLFSEFKKNALVQYKPSHALTKLENYSNNRGSLFFNDLTTFNPNWTGDAELNYVTDDYYFRDFGNILSSVNNNQLLNRANVNYQNEHWNFMAQVMGFQTLHLITQDTTTSIDQYARLPQLELIGDYPNEKYGLDYQLRNEFVYFYRSRDFNTRLVPVTGSRFNVQPGVTLPLNWSGMYSTPSIQMPLTFYLLNNQMPYKQDDITRFAPIFSIDNGVVFQRHFSNNYLQTIEPELYYLYVPYIKQGSIPVFDTDIPVFSYDSLFRANRFSGIDRVGDANQVALGLTSRFIDANSGEQKFQTSIGEIFAFHKHDICVNNNCLLDPLVEHKVSPLIAEVKYNFNPKWSVTGTGAWDFWQHRVNNAGANFQYQAGENRLINVGYNYVADGDFYANKTVNLNRIDANFSWPISKNWLGLADWNYNISAHNSLAYLYGVEYNSCCFAVRLVASRVFTGYDNFNHALYDKRYYLQVLLKGMGNFGTSSAGDLLTNRLTGFHDQFTAG